MPAPAPSDLDYLQYGSHTVGPAAWRNFDASPTLRLQRLPVVGPVVQRRLPAHRPRFPDSVEYGDIVRGLPVETGRFRGVYCSHVLEHLTREDCRTALRHTYAYLQPGGVFRLVMPDLRALASAYLEHAASDAAHHFMSRAWLGRQTRSSSLVGRAVSAVGNAHHLWMWDYASMHDALEEVGFVEIRRAHYGDAEDPRFSDVEDPARWEEPGFDGEGTISCLGVECRRPR